MTHMEVGDQMQSALSRILGWLDDKQLFDVLPYEVGQAVLEGGSAVEDWTGLRRHDRPDPVDLSLIPMQTRGNCRCACHLPVGPERGFVSQQACDHCRELEKSP